MSSDWRIERIARNEASFRDINERLEQGLRQVQHRPEHLELVCECGDRECQSHIFLTLQEYEDVRRDSRWFAVVPGHVFVETERVVARHDRYEIVEKFGEAVEMTDAADARELGARGRRSSGTP
jgi:hypothetical protein